MPASDGIAASPWWRRILRPFPVGFRPPPDRLVSLVLLWDGDGWLVQSGIGAGSETVWQRHGSRDDLLALLAEGLGVSWVEAHNDVSALDPVATLATMAGHDGSVARWIDSCRAGARGFTMALDTSTGLTVTLRPVDLLAGPPVAPAAVAEASSVALGRPALASGLDTAGAVRVDLRARTWVREVERWDLVARSWLIDASAWLDAAIDADWRVAAWWLPEPDSLSPRRPLLANDVPQRVARFLAGEPLASTADATASANADGTSRRRPAAYGLVEPARTGRWLVVSEWDPENGADDEPAGALGLVRSERDGLVEIRCYYWPLRSGAREPLRVSASGRSIWYLSGRDVVQRLLGDAVAAFGVPPDWDLSDS